MRTFSANSTLSATDLANEAYTRIAGAGSHDWQDRAHFFAFAASAIRNILVDHLRASGSVKRGGNLPFVKLHEIDVDTQIDCIDLEVDWLSVHKALEELEAIDPDCAQVVELKFFSGLTTDEIAEAIGSSRATVVRDWRFARVWLADRLQSARIGGD